jgi:two-component system CheB/CheR fusion protein
MLPGGEPTSNVFRLIRDELRADLQVILRQVREHGKPVDSKPIGVRFNGHPIPVVMHVRPSSDLQQEGFVLIIFEERAATKEETPAPPAANPGTGDGERIRELQAEVVGLNHRLQSIVEEYESSQEEMKASNEEMQSTNEELRSTMEELETSKEELQSINEELQTVNQENRHKVEELAQLTGDLQNLLVATDIATLFLDRTFRILRFTPKLSEIFNIRVTDRGRPIFDLTHRLGYRELSSDAASVLERLVPIEREVSDEAGRWYLTRVLPYRSTDDRIEGVVITFIDISSRKKAEMALRESEEALRHSLAEKEALLKEVHHRVKNNLQIIISLLSLQARQIEDQNMLAHFEEARNRVQSIASIHELIYQSSSFAAVELGPYAKKLVNDVLRLHEAEERIQAEVRADTSTLELQRAVPFALLLNELLSNVCKHAFAPHQRGTLRIDIRNENGKIVAEVSDNGVGLPADFDTRENKSLGIFLVRRLAKQLEGEVDFRSNQGTTVRIQIPVVAKEL